MAPSAKCEMEFQKQLRGNSAHWKVLVTLYFAGHQFEPPVNLGMSQVFNMNTNIRRFLGHIPQGHNEPVPVGRDAFPVWFVNRHPDLYLQNRKRTWGQQKYYKFCTMNFSWCWKWWEIRTSIRLFWISRKKQVTHSVSEGFENKFCIGCEGIDNTGVRPSSL